MEVVDLGSYKIAEARRAKGWSQQALAEKMGTTQQQIARWETGQRDPKADVILKMSSILGATVSYLLGVDSDSGYIQALPARSYSMPVLGRIAAGTPREALSQSDETKQATEDLYTAHPNAFWLVVAGNSMNRLFPEGALVLVDPDSEVRSGDVAAIFVNGDDATIKRVYFDDGTVRLHPESWDPDYRDRTIDPSDPDAPAVRVIGRAVSYAAPDGWRG